VRLGLFGGSFDPVHYGHLLLAEQCRAQCAVDAVWFIPTHKPPHKNAESMTAASARLDMLELAIAGAPAFQISRVELDRDKTTFTVDTLQQLRAENADRELFFLIGADSLADLPFWREPERITELATIVAVNRGDRPFPDLEPLRQRIGDCVSERVQFVSMPGIDISSSDIRRRVQQNQSIRFLVPRAVEAYIHEHRLYVD